MPVTTTMRLVKSHSRRWYRLSISPETMPVRSRKSRGLVVTRPSTV